MKVKILSASIVAGFLLFNFSGCAKHNAAGLGGGACDTTAVRYSMQVVDILQNNCYGCHKGPGASSGIDFSSYVAFKGWAGAGFVTGDITGASGYTPMPYGLPHLSDCDIDIIVAWIHQGMPNN